MRYEDFAYDRSKTRRRELRSEIRNALGTSSADAPNVHEVLYAANKLQALLDLASGGRFGLAVIDLGATWQESDEETARTGKPRKVIFISQALSHVRWAKESGKTRL